MGGYPQVYESWGGALAAAVTTALGPGDTVSYSRTLANDYGSAQSAGAMTGVRLALEVKISGVWRRSGHPALDDGWASLRIVDVENDGDATFGPYSTGSKRIGASADFETRDIPENCGLNFTLRWDAPSDIPTTAFDWRLVPLWDQNSVATGAKLGEARGGGVLPGWRDLSTRKVVTGREIITAGTDSITVERGTWDYDGTRGATVRSAHTLNQNDVAAAALAAGQAYIAAITQDSTGVVTVTKGAKATTPVAPALPADHIFLRYVNVDYQVGGTSIIDGADLSGTFIRGDYYVEAGTGLSVEIHSGRALYGTSNFGFHDIVSVCSVTASITNYVWARPDGTFSATATEVAPLTGAELLCEADADGSAVTAVRRRASALGIPVDEVAIEFRLGDVSTTGTFLDYTEMPWDWDLKSIKFMAKSLSGGAAGSYKIDVNVAYEGEPSGGTHTTIYTSQGGSDDRRPSIAYNATVLSFEEEFHEVRRGNRGARISIDVDDIPAGGTLSDARVILFVRRRR